MYDKKLLKAELILHGYTFKKLAELLKISSGTISKKVNSVSEWTLSEIQSISLLIGPEKVLSIFFANNVS